MSHKQYQSSFYHNEDFDDRNNRERPRRTNQNHYPYRGPPPHQHQPRGQHPRGMHGSGHMSRSRHEYGRHHRPHHPPNPRDPRADPRFHSSSVSSPRGNMVPSQGHRRYPGPPSDPVHIPPDGPGPGMVMHNPSRGQSLHARPVHHGSQLGPTGNPSGSTSGGRPPNPSGGGPSSSAGLTSGSGPSGGPRPMPTGISSQVGPPPSRIRDDERVKLKQFVQQLTVPDRRETSLAHLSKRRESFPDLAPMLWNTKAVVACLLQEVIQVYPNLTNPSGNGVASGNRCCNALALLQCIASHPETRRYFLNAYIPLFLYPFLNTDNTARSHEYLRLTSLGVIGALVKNPQPMPRDDQMNGMITDGEVVQFLLKTEIIPLCLRIMEKSSGLSKTVATFIVQKILLDDAGLGYVCATAERFYTVSNVFRTMVMDEVGKSSGGQRPSKRLLKHIVRCYLRLTEDRRAKIALGEVLPKPLREEAFDQHFQDDAQTLQWLQSLRENLRDPPSSGSGTRRRPPA